MGRAPATARRRGLPRGRDGPPRVGEAPPAQIEQAPWVDVIETTDALGIERAVLAGSSFGGAVALRVAIVAPDRIDALALFSAPAPGIEPSAELEAAWESEETALEAGDIDGAISAVLDAWTLPDGPPDVRARVAAMQRRAFAHQDADPAPEGPDPAEERPESLADVTARTLVAVGEHDMSDFHVGAEAMLRALPNATHAVIEGAGHLAPLEQPDAFRALLLQFLR